ncbi:MAG TPA: hypothetical protein VK763_01795 [Terriglobales bacterium]|nr:hypothetical protein [Terriglobales bacterium]
MTEQDMDAVVGKARREYREATKELAAVRAQANQASQFAIKLENALNDPARIRFLENTPGPGVVMRLPGTPQYHYVTFREGEFEQITPEAIKSLSAECQRLEQRVEVLRQQIISLEGEDPQVETPVRRAQSSRY